MKKPELSEADRRGAALIARHGYAVVVHKRGYWISGGHRIAQITVRRLLKIGALVADPQRPKTRVVANGTTRKLGGAEYLPPDAQAELGRAYWPEAGRRRATAEEWEETDAWSPPEYTDERGRPLAVDRILKGEE